MPDGISAAVINGETYLLTANDGDSRAWQAGSETDTNEIKDKTSPVNGIRTGGKVTWFDAHQYDGLWAGVAYIFGVLSFTVTPNVEPTKESAKPSSPQAEQRPLRKPATEAVCTYT